jgi:hypothetical protein
MHQNSYPYNKPLNHRNVRCNQFIKFTKLWTIVTDTQSANLKLNHLRLYRATPPFSPS